MPSRLPSSKRGSTVWLEWADGSLVRDFENRPVFTGCQIIWADPAKASPPPEMPPKRGETPAVAEVLDLLTETTILVRWKANDALTEIGAACVRVIKNPPPFVPQPRKIS